MGCSFIVRLFPSEVWDSEDFIIYFEGHWETWEFNKDTQSVRCRGGGQKKMGWRNGDKNMNKQDTCGLWCLCHLMPSYSILCNLISFYTILYHFIPSYTILFHFISSDTYGQMIRWVNRKQQTYLRGHTLLGITRIGRSQGYVRFFKFLPVGHQQKSQKSPQEASFTLW